MPTGYTSEIYNDKKTTFAQYVWRCARAFGALMHLRDEPWDSDIPMNVKEETYHKEQLTQAMKELSAIKRMTSSEIARATKEANEKAVREWEESQKRATALDNRYKEMLAKCVDWVPPTKDHNELKKFMVEQLRSSIDFDVHFREKPKPLSEDEWYKETLKSAEWSVTYHQEGREKEVQRCNGTNQWTEALNKSVPYEK